MLTHARQLVRYLEHHHSLSSYTARDAKLTSLTHSGLGIEANGKAYTIPFEPPMKSFSEARERVVKLDNDAISALGRSDITIREYRFARGVQFVIMISVLAGFFSFSYRDMFRPGNWIYEVFWGNFPRFSAFLYEWAYVALALMVLIHGVEAIVMASGRLRKHSVPAGSGVWWKWATSAYCEGYGAFARYVICLLEKSLQIWICGLANCATGSTT